MKYGKSAVILGIILILVTIHYKQPQKQQIGSDPLDVFQQQQAMRQEKERGMLTRGVYRDLTLNPLQADSAEQMTFLRDLLEGLVIYDRRGEIAPAVAEKWQTDDNKIWIFSLRKEAKWSNGEALTAHDFMRSWRQLALSGNRLSSYLQFMNIANAQAVIQKTLPVEQLGISVPDEHTLRIELDKPTPYLPKMLAHIALMPRYGGESVHFVGNGAYQLAAQNGDIIRLQQNSHYRNAAAVAFPQVQYQKITAAQDLNALNAPDIVEQPKSISKSAVDFPRLCTYFYEFNFNHPLLKESAVRKALVSMISPISIVQNEKLPGRADGSYLPKNMQFENENIWEPALLEQLFLQFGISEKNPLKLRLSYDNSLPHSAIARRLIQAWSQSDLIRIEADPQPKAALLEKRAKGDFHIIRSGWCADYNEPSAFLNLAYSKSPDNKVGYKNQAVDELLEQTLANNITEEKRTALYRQVYQILRNEHIVLPVFQYTGQVHIKPNISGYSTDNPTGVIYSKDLSRKIPHIP